MKRHVALTCGLGWFVSVVLFVGTSHAQKPNIPVGPRGTLPAGEDGKPLNLDFETGTLKDWTATGKAFERQPHKGKIDPKESSVNKLPE